MTERLEQTIQTALTFPSHMRDDVAGMVLACVGHDEPMIELTPEAEADLIEAQAQMEHGEFAINAAVDAVFSKYRL